MSTNSDNKPQLMATNVASTESKPNMWSGFYKKTIQERQDQIKLVYPHLNPQESLPSTVADNMIENCIGTFELPMGLGLNFLINGTSYAIPMTVEEPSVIAAVSGSAKTVEMSGGFTACSSGSIMISQIQLLDTVEPEKAAKKILDNKPKLIAYANQFCPSMKKRGGGVVDLRVRLVKYNKNKYSDYADKDDIVKASKKIDLNELVTTFDNTLVQPDGSILKYQNPEDNTLKQSTMLIVHAMVDVCESMGANIVTTVAEGLAPKLLELIGSGRYVLRIVSNLCEERRAKASFLIPFSKLKYKDVDGAAVAKGIMEAYMMAAEDKFRATTHNKGIMNGVDAVALALGQDWRAIEAGAHAWATRTGRYLPLTTYKLVQQKATNPNEKPKQFLYGQCEFPVPVGVRGGAIGTHPIMSYTHGLLGTPNTRLLSEVLVCVGLAQNFAAMRALVTEGIQRGHMSLHSRNIAIAAGVPAHLISEVSSYMVSRGHIDQETAKDYLRAHSVLVSSTASRFRPQKQATPSTLFVELSIDGAKITLNVVFETIGTSEPVHLDLTDGEELLPVQVELFEGKGSAYLTALFDEMNKIRVIKNTQKSTLALQNKMKLLSILQNILIYRLMKLYPDETADFLEKILAAELNPLSALTEKEPLPMRVGFALVVSLWQVFKHQVEANVTVLHLASSLKEEQCRIFSASIRSRELMKLNQLEKFLQIHCKRWQVTMFLLIDLHGLPTNVPFGSERLFFFFKLGMFFEYEGTIARDVARCDRDKAEGEPNLYLFWLQLNKKDNSKESLNQFQQEMGEMQDRREKKLFDAKEPPELFDVNQFQTAIPVLREWKSLSNAKSLPKIPKSKL